MDQLQASVGYEKSLDEVSDILHQFARTLGVCDVGALHLTCADEAERECAEAFHQGFVQYLLPPLKFAKQSAFRLANLGGRYEWGAVRLAESHFVSSRVGHQSKLMVVKVNAHVSCEYVDDEDCSAAIVKYGDGRFCRFGIWKRYGVDSHCCGALHHLLDGCRDPYVEELRTAFSIEGIDRVGVLLDKSCVDPAYRPLLAAIVSARIQARKVVLDVQDYSPVTPTMFLVVPCVTINRHERDTEIICGTYFADVPDGKTTCNQGGHITYFGLGDDPAGFQVRFHHGMVQVVDDQLGTERRACNLES